MTPGRTPQDEEEAIETLYDTFDIEPPQAVIKQHRLGRKGKFTEPLTIDPKKGDTDTFFFNGTKKLGRGVLWGHILSYPKDGLVQPKHILWASSLGEDNFSFLTKHLTDRLQAKKG